MKEIIINDHTLDESEMEKKVTRVKGLIINSQGKILLAHNNNTYQFPGGHTEKNETRDECIIREIKEETGIQLEIKEPPFLCITTYDNNYFGTGKKVINSIYYYRFFTDEEPDYSKTHYDELELATDFNLFYIKFTKLKSFLQKSQKNGSIDKKIAREMLYVLDEYREIYQKEGE